MNNPRQCNFPRKMQLITFYLNDQTFLSHLFFVNCNSFKTKLHNLLQGTIVWLILFKCFFTLDKNGGIFSKPSFYVNSVAFHSAFCDLCFPLFLRAKSIQVNTGLIIHQPAPSRHASVTQSGCVQSRDAGCSKPYVFW